MGGSGVAAGVRHKQVAWVYVVSYATVPTDGLCAWFLYQQRQRQVYFCALTAHNLDEARGLRPAVSMRRGLERRQAWGHLLHVALLAYGATCFGPPPQGSLVWSNETRSVHVTQTRHLFQQFSAKEKKLCMYALSRRLAFHHALVVANRFV